MKAKQITTYHVKGEAKTWEKALAPEDESKSVKMIESNVINLYPDFAFQTIEGFGGAMTESTDQPTGAEVKGEAQSKARGKVAWLDSFLE